MITDFAFDFVQIGYVNYNVGYQFYQQGGTSIYAAGGFARSEYSVTQSSPPDAAWLFTSSNGFNSRFTIDARYTRVDSDMSGVGFGASFHF